MLQQYQVDKQVHFSCTITHLQEVGKFSPFNLIILRDCMKNAKPLLHLAIKILVQFYDQIVFFLAFLF